MQPFSRRGAIDLKIAAIKREDGAQRFAAGKMHERGVGKLRTEVLKFAYESRKRREIIVTERKDYIDTQLRASQQLFNRRHRILQ